MLTVFLGKLHYLWQNMGVFFLLWLAVSLIVGFLMFLILKRQHRKLPAVMAFNLLLLVFIFNTLFFAGEFYFRFIFDSSDNFGFLQTCQRWLDRHVIYNADEFRDRPFSTVKKPGLTRIAVLGDSFSFGWGLNDVNQRFSNLLEKKLNGVEVYNTSVPGWESTNELKFLQERAGMFKFDTVILSYVLNDIYGDRAVESMPFLNQKYVDIREWPIFKPLMAHSFFLEFMITRLFHTRCR